MPLLGKRANLPTACLPLLAALTPPEFDVELVDENVEELDFQRLASADIVALTGMSVQRHRMREILGEFRQRGSFLVVGGPWATVREDYFGELVDVVFVGEAEVTWPQFLSDWISGTHVQRYEQAHKTDMTTVPTPRLDMLDTRQYAFGSLQISRGCPFQCEFCDIIVTFGRRPRLKSVSQVIHELDAMRRAKLQIAFIVDDNLIGNKSAIKPILREIASWQGEHGFPFSFFAEASLDLADDDEMIALLIQCNVQAVFVGIETTNLAALRETKKFQNLRGGGTLLEKVERIQKQGLEVWSGMMLGFDSDTPEVFSAQVEFVSSARIIHAMCGMLSAIPKTPLYERLKAENRLNPGDELTYGTNVVPKQMTQEQLYAGYKEVMLELSSADNYFDRVDSLFLDPEFVFNQSQRQYWQRHPLQRLSYEVRMWVICLVLKRRILSRIEDSHLQKKYRKQLRQAWRRRPDISVYFVYLLKCAIHFHYTQFNSRHLQGSVVNTF